jgi:hypothetical protein
VAAYKANENLVQELVGPKYRADINISGGKYGSSLQAAVRTSRMAIVKHILSKSNVNANVAKYGSALQAVARGVNRTRMPLPELSRGQALKQLAQISPGHYVDREETQKNYAGETNYIEVANALFGPGARMVSFSFSEHYPLLRLVSGCSYERVAWCCELSPGSKRYRRPVC